MNPVDIITRAAATVPSGAGTDRRAESSRREPHFAGTPAQRQGELALPPTGWRGGSRAHPARGRWVRRWHRHRDRLRRNLLRFLTAIVLTSPLWLWQAGQLDRAQAWILATQKQLAGTARLTLGQVQIEGRSRADRQAIERALGARRGMPILDFDLEGAKARIEALPWIARAVVERRLPDTIFVGVTERRPIARWRLDGKTLLVDSDGIAIRTRQPERWAALPLIAGRGAPAAIGRLLEFLATQPTLAKRVASSRRLGKRRWDIVFDNGVVLMLPEDKPAAAWRRFARIEARHRLLARGLTAIDLRLPDQIILRAPGTQLPPLPRRGGPGRST
jgi:cell division protein FtsQ